VNGDGHVRWRLLGPLGLRTAESWAGVGAPKLRALLAVLLVEPGRVVSIERLVDELWGEDPGPGVRKLVSQYVFRLRRLAADPDARVLVTEAPGYRLAITADEVDAGRFEALLAEGRAALRDQDAERAADLSARALSMWRGAALADVPRGPLVAAEASRLEELRVAAIELRIEAGLRCGQADDFVPELRRLIAADPLREPFWYQLMRVLDQGGRPAEALAAYARVREILADELGADPGPDLQELHRRILAGQPVPDAPARDDRGRAGAAVPRQLPAAVRHFVGRTRELAMLSGYLDAESGAEDGLVISAIAGSAGVGKTALAVHWAHQVADRFPDGQLYVNLRGYDPGAPMPAAEALAGFLRALGVPGRDIPAEADERAAQYRGLLAGRRVLVLLDNAASAEQVRPLLPASSPCVAVVTSRDALAGLVARDGARRLDLELLRPADAEELLTRLIGERAAADPEATARLAAQCARLPLALRVAAELAAAQPALALTELVGELADQQRRLDFLQADDDPRTAVRAVFSWSYRHLDAGAARTFRLAGLHPGPDFECYAAAALAGTGLAPAQRLLDLLTRAHLVQRTGPGRYSLHDLLGAYARELSAQAGGEDEQRAALTRLFDYYLHAAATAVDTLYPADHHRRPSVPEPGTPSAPVTDPAAARAWLDAERASLVAVAARAAASGWAGHATRLAVTLFRYLDTGGHYTEAVSIYSSAHQAARLTGNRGAEAEALASLGTVELRQGRYEQATGHGLLALAIFRETGDRSGEAQVLHNLGGVALLQGRWEQAADRFEQAAELCRQTGDRYGEARSLINTGIVALQRGRWQEASDHNRRALRLCRAVGDRSGEAYILNSLGIVERRKGRPDSAADYHQLALAIFRETGDRSGEAYALTGLGDVGQRADFHEQALVIFRETGDAAGQAKAFNGLGEALFGVGQPESARARHSDALDLAGEIGDKYEEARAHNGLGLAYHATGEPDQAQRHWRDALSLYADLGAPEADEVRDRAGRHAGQSRHAG